MDGREDHDKSFGAVSIPGVNGWNVPLGFLGVGSGCKRYLGTDHEFFCGMLDHEWL